METANGKKISPERLKRLQGYAETWKNPNGASMEAIKDLHSASDTDRRESRKMAGIVSERGSRSDVSVSVNTVADVPMGWRETYGLKALASHLGGSLTIVVTPEGKPDAKPVPQAKIREFLELIGNAEEKGMTPSQVAEKVAAK